MIFNLLMGIGGFLLAGDSLGIVFRADKPMLKIAILGAAEFFSGMYFLIAAIGGT
jgi:hypothetical protein